MRHTGCRAELVERHALRRSPRFQSLEVLGVEAVTVGQLDHVLRVGQVLAQQREHLGGVERLDVEPLVLEIVAVARAQDDGAVRAHHELGSDLQGSEDAAVPSQLRPVASMTS